MKIMLYAVNSIPTSSFVNSSKFFRMRWRDGLEVNTASCSSRRPKFDFYHPYGNLELVLFQRCLHGHQACICCTNIHAGKKKLHTHKKINIQKMAQQGALWQKFDSWNPCKKRCHAPVTLVPYFEIECREVADQLTWWQTARETRLQQGKRREVISRNCLSWLLHMHHGMYVFTFPNIQQWNFPPSSIVVHIYNLSIQEIEAGCGKM